MSDATQAGQRLGALVFGLGGAYFDPAKAKEVLTAGGKGTGVHEDEDELRRKRRAKLGVGGCSCRKRGA